MIHDYITHFTYYGKEAILKANAYTLYLRCILNGLIKINNTIHL